MRKQKLYLHSHNQLRNLYNELHVYETKFSMHVKFSIYCILAKSMKELTGICRLITATKSHIFINVYVLAVYTC